MAQKKVTLSLDEELYKKFQEFCEENEIMLSKRIEKLILKHLEEEEEQGISKLKEIEKAPVSHIRHYIN